MPELSELPELIHRATAAAHNAYAPYSHFRVGAALLLETGHIIAGCNVENASYRLTSCAEQAAIAAAVATHGPHIRLRAVVVVNLNHAASAPCGACRQTILEFATPATLIYYPAGGPETTLTQTTAADLLPAAFNQASLK